MIANFETIIRTSVSAEVFFCARNSDGLLDLANTG